MAADFVRLTLTAAAQTAVTLLLATSLLLTTSFLGTRVLLGFPARQ